MANIPISQPELVRQFGNLNVQRGVMSDGASEFLAKSLVYITAGVIAAVPTAGVLVYGWCADKSRLATDPVPEAIFGENHWPFSLNDAEIEINITNDAEEVGAAGPQLSSVAIGTAYGLVRLAAGADIGKQCLNVEDVTTTLLVVTGIPDGQALTDRNGRVRCKVIPSKIQAGP